MAWTLAVSCSAMQPSAVSVRYLTREDVFPSEGKDERGLLSQIRGVSTFIFTALFVLIHFLVESRNIDFDGYRVPFVKSYWLSSNSNTNFLQSIQNTFSSFPLRLRKEKQLIASAAAVSDAPARLQSQEEPVISLDSLFRIRD
jgi:hypothetical protein